MACQIASEEKIAEDKTEEDGIKTIAVDGMVEDKSVDTSLTMSTKLSSTDQLICKTPRDSPSQSVKSVKTFEKIKIEEANGDDSYLLYLGALQILFGFLMSLCGIMVILHDASLSQFGGGIWGGCLAMATGITGVMAAAKEWCPLKSTPQKIAHTSFLALSLISLAVSQLIVALAATGLGRDLNNSEYDFQEQVTTTTTPASLGKISITLPLNYLSLLSNTGLLIVSAVECILAAVASYKCSRTLCPCFRKDEEKLTYEIQNGYRHALVSSWLGKHSSTPLYFVAAPPSSAGPGSKLSGSLPITPVFTIPQSMVHPPVVRYPLIPAPLGTIPSPIIPPPSREELLRRHKKYISKYHRHPPRDHRAQRRSRSRSKEKSVTEEDVARTYTGLDKTIAENFIDICDLKNAASSSLCSDSNCSCSSSCRRSCNGGCSNSNSSSDVNSREYLVNKM